MWILTVASVTSHARAITLSHGALHETVENLRPRAPSGCGEFVAQVPLRVTVVAV
jgi:hypothetical protein